MELEQAARALLAKAYAVDSTTEVELLADEFSALELALDQPASQAPQPKGSAPLPLTDMWRRIKAKLPKTLGQQQDELFLRFDACLAALSASQLSVQAPGPSVDPTERSLLRPEAPDVEPTEEQLLALATDGGGASFLLPMQKQAALNRGREAWERFKAAAPLTSRAPRAFAQIG